MLLEEFRTLAGEELTEEDLDAVNLIYCLLDFDKDDFCKLITALGIEKWKAKTGWWQMLSRRYEAGNRLEKLTKSRQRLAELQEEIASVQEQVAALEQVYDMQLTI